MSHFWQAVFFSCYRMFGFVLRNFSMSLLTGLCPSWGKFCRNVFFMQYLLCFHALVPKEIRLNTVIDDFSNCWTVNQFNHTWEQSGSQISCGRGQGFLLSAHTSRKNWSRVCLYDLLRNPWRTPHMQHLWWKPV